MQKIPQIYPTNIAPYSKYYCTVHIVHFTEGWVGWRGGICDKKIVMWILLVILRGKDDKFSEKGGGHSYPKYFVADSSNS